MDGWLNEFGMTKLSTRIFLNMSLKGPSHLLGDKVKHYISALFEVKERIGHSSVPRKGKVGSPAAMFRDRQQNIFTKSGL